MEYRECLEINAAAEEVKVIIKLMCLLAGINTREALQYTCNGHSTANRMQDCSDVVSTRVGATKTTAAC